MSRRDGDGSASAGTATSPPVTPSTTAPTWAPTGPRAPPRVTATTATTTPPAATTPTTSTPASHASFDDTSDAEHGTHRDIEPNQAPSHCRRPDRDALAGAGRSGGLLGEPVGARLVVLEAEAGIRAREHRWSRRPAPGRPTMVSGHGICRSERSGPGWASHQRRSGGGRRLRQSYAGGAMWWSGRTGAWETHGAIGLRYLAIGDVTRGSASGRAGGRCCGRRRQSFLGGTSGGRTTARGVGDRRRDRRSTGAGPGRGAVRVPGAARVRLLRRERQDFEHEFCCRSVQPVARRDVRIGVGWRRMGILEARVSGRPASLTLIRVNYWGFDNAVHRGEIIVRSDLAGRVASIGSALTEHYPIRQMWRVDYFRGDDPASMADDNTCGFNCRQVTGGSGFTPFLRHRDRDQHLENPYYAGGPGGRRQSDVDRNNVRWDAIAASVTRAFAAQGFSLGAATGRPASSSSSVSSRRRPGHPAPG